MTTMMTEQDRIELYNNFIENHIHGGKAILLVPTESTKGKALHNNFGQWLVDNGFFTAPASTKYHGAHEGGLFDHSLCVAEQLVKLTDKLNLVWSDENSPVVVGLFHDLCKIDKYKFVEATPNTPAHYEYKDKLMYEGHGMRSLALLQGHIVLTQEEAACIVYHMGAYETTMWDGYDTAIRKFPNVLFTHTADMIASKIEGV